jgi:exosortase/archaeosortase family protein
MSLVAKPGWAAGLNPMMALCLQALAFWPVWRWYGLRLGDSGEEAWGVASLLGAAWVIFKNRDGVKGRIGPAPVCATLLYAAAYPILPPLPRAVAALAALGCLLPSLGLSPRAALHAAGFLILSLPMMASLQFYLGYPLRVAGGEMAARLINLAGFPVVRDGTLLAWRDHVVFIDAPCSGVKMLWAGMILALALSALRGHGPLGTMVMGAAAVGAVFAGNVFRTMALFFLETGVVKGPVWAHSAVGVSAFIAAASALAWMGRWRPRFQFRSLRESPCAT